MLILLEMASRERSREGELATIPGRKHQSSILPLLLIQQKPLPSYTKYPRYHPPIPPFTLTSSDHPTHPYLCSLIHHLHTLSSTLPPAIHPNKNRSSSTLPLSHLLLFYPLPLYPIQTLPYTIKPVPMQSANHLTQ